MSPNKLFEAYIECRNQIDQAYDYTFFTFRQQRLKLAKKIEDKLKWRIYDLTVTDYLYNK